jgi:hypothetical protein
MQEMEEQMKIAEEEIRSRREEQDRREAASVRK